MRPAQFEDKDIIDAGLALQSEGRNVTGFAIRSRIGGGRAERLIEVWKEYRATEAAVTADPVAELPVELEEEVRELSSALTERLFKIARELNDKAVRAAERRITEISRAAGEQVTHAEREMADASRTVEDLEESLTKLRTEYSISLEQVNVMSKKEHQLELQLAKLQERLTGAQNQLEAAERRISDTRQEHQRTIDNLRAQHISDMKELRTEHEQKESELNRRIDDAAVKMNNIIIAHEEAEKTQLNRLNTMEEKSNKDRETANNNLDKQKEENSRLLEEKSLLAGEVRTLTSQNKQLMKLLESAGKPSPKPKNDKV